MMNQTMYNARPLCEQRCLTSSLALHPTAGTSGILGVGGTQSEVYANKDGLIGVRRVMSVTLTADHRTVYGADSAEFLVTLKKVIEDPDQLLR